jgi:hypothetical protein
MTYPHDNDSIKNGAWGCDGEQWLETEAAKSGSEPVPAGDYQAMIMKCEIKKTRSNDKYLNTYLYIINGTHRGRYVFKSFFFSEKARPYTKADLQTLEIEISHPRELEAESKLYEFIGKVIDITVSNKSYGEKLSQNVYINKFIKQLNEKEMQEIINNDVMPF